MKRALVTGGSGFIGSHLVDKLRKHGLEVRIYDKRAPSHHTDVDFVQGDILSLPDLRRAMQDADVVFHLAAIADVKDVFKDPLHAEAVNTRGTLNALEAAREARTPKRFVYASTTWVYGDCELQVVDEHTPLGAPSHLYTATKLAGEHYCRSYSSLYQLPVTILRYGIPYGPRARAGTVIPVFVDKALRKEPLTVTGDGLQFRKFVYVEDLADAHVLALAPVAANKVYNLDGLEKLSIRHIAESVRAQLGGLPIEYVPARPGDFSGKDVSSKRAEEELGWRPGTPFEEGLCRYLQWRRAPDALLARSSTPRQLQREGT